MPDIILPGSAGRIEVRYQRQKPPGAPMALVLHPHPQFGGTMNNPLVYDLFHMFHNQGCTTVRFNFRGVGRSQGYIPIRQTSGFAEYRSAPGSGCSS
jgi:alpha/beta superfamily hydrolase